MSLLRRVGRRTLATSNLTVAALFRVIEAACPTLLIDEADTFLTPEREELRGAINAGHSRGMDVVLRIEGDAHDLAAFHVFGFKALAMIGMPPDTITDRAIVIQLNRKPPDTHVAKLRMSLRGCFCGFSASLPGRQRHSTVGDVHARSRLDPEWTRAASP